MTNPTVQNGANECQYNDCTGHRIEFLFVCHVLGRKKFHYILRRKQYIWILTPKRYILGFFSRWFLYENICHLYLFVYIN